MNNTQSIIEISRLYGEALGFVALASAEFDRSGSMQWAEILRDAENLRDTLRDMMGVNDE